MNYNRLNNYLPREHPAASESETSNSIVESLTPTVNRVGEFVANAIRKQPLAGVSLGLALGVVLGCLVKRR